MSNLSQLIQTAVSAWRDGRSGAALADAEGAVVQFDQFEVVIRPLPRESGRKPAVDIEVLGSDGETLAEARIELADA